MLGSGQTGNRSICLAESKAEREKTEAATSCRTSLVEVNLPMSFSPERQQEIRRSILDFLEKQALQSAIHPMCPHAGAP